MQNKKGQVLSNLGGLAIGIATLTIALTVVFLILSQARTQVYEVEGLTGSVDTNQSSVALNATRTLTDSVATIPDWVPLIVIAVIGSILLGLVALFRRQ